MNCTQVRELLPDLAAGMNIDKGTEDVQTHISSCSACAAKLQGFRQTMALLDQWQAPDPGPYGRRPIRDRISIPGLEPASAKRSRARQPDGCTGCADLPWQLPWQ